MIAGSTDVKVNVPYIVEQSETKRFTYLDSNLNGGRPVLILRSSNIVEEHDKKVVISYNFNRSQMIVEPLMLVGLYFFLFLIGSLLSFASYVAVSKTTAKPTVRICI